MVEIGRGIMHKSTTFSLCYSLQVAASEDNKVCFYYFLLPAAGQLAQSEVHTWSWTKGPALLTMTMQAANWIETRKWKYFSVYLASIIFAHAGPGKIHIITAIFLRNLVKICYLLFTVASLGSWPYFQISINIFLIIVKTKRVRKQKLTSNIGFFFEFFPPLHFDLWKPSLLYTVYLMLRQMSWLDLQLTSWIFCLKAESVSNKSPLAK